MVHLVSTVFSDVYPAPVYSPQRGKMTKNCGLDNIYPALLYTRTCLPAPASLGYPANIGNIYSGCPVTQVIYHVRYLILTV